MKKLLTAIALMVGLASPTSKVMSQLPPTDKFIFVAAMINRYPNDTQDYYAEYKDQVCAGIGDFGNYRLGMPATVRDMEGNILSITEVNVAHSVHDEKLGEWCMFTVPIPFPESEKFTLTLGGAIVRPEQTKVEQMDGYKVLLIDLRE